MLLSSVVAVCALFFSVAEVQAAAIPVTTTTLLAPRAVGSGANACYFKCPANAGSGTTLAANRPAARGRRQCEYAVFNGARFCYYFPDGSLDYGVPGCQRRAADAGCGSNTDPANNFRRAVVARTLSPAERLIKERQYKPMKAVLPV